MNDTRDPGRDPASTQEPPRLEEVIADAVRDSAPPGPAEPLEPAAEPVAGGQADGEPAQGEGAPDSQ